ncbi:MAG TPA: alpha/beta hydrolase-fold protein [Flavisolibacter sp.]|nr:alpha/beta hydrolase-fold protein [Flavisolibacter sp.]
MYKVLLCIVVVLQLNGVCALHKVSIRLRSLPAYHNKDESVFIAGSFNGWHPGIKDYQFGKDSSGIHLIQLDLPKGRHEFKLTRGSWEKGERDGNSLGSNRSIEITGDTSIYISVMHWADHFPKEPRKSTASKNVKIIETAFYIPQLNRYRRLWIYLPNSYATSGKKYPVLYLNDGQNVFEDTTSFTGEWGIDEALDTLENGAGEMIVVAVDHGGDKRINEYAPFNMERYGKGEGDAYINFLVKTLRPYINKNYRTKTQAKHNYTAGSSTGGLISFYALLKYPRSWGGAGVFSPAFWIAPQLKGVVARKAKKVKGRIYFFAGQQESKTMVPDMLSVFTELNKHSKAKMALVIRAEGKHNEATWRKEFPAFYQWLAK